MKLKYTKDNLSELVKNSNNITDILIKLDMRAAGGNYRTIKNYIDKYSIDTSHFIKSIDILNNHQNANKLKYEDLFVKDCIHKRGTVKRYIFKHNIIQNVCVLCGQDDNWNGKKMSLILDHKNGVYNDNRLENLRIVCPNCNATLDTHCGKNKVKPRDRKTYFNDAKNYYELEQQKYVKLITDSEIDFSRHGWVSAVSSLIDKKPQKINTWMKRFMSDFYNVKCFKRK
jgi:hypothetical protein